MTKAERIKVGKYKESIVAQYSSKQKQLQSEKMALELENKKLRNEIDKLREINSKLEDNIRQQEDWIERLLEYTNMSEEQLKQVKLDLQAREQLNKTFASFYEILFGGYRFG